MPLPMQTGHLSTFVMSLLYVIPLNCRVSWILLLSQDSSWPPSRHIQPFWLLASWFYSCASCPPFMVFYLMSMRDSQCHAPQHNNPDNSHMALYVPGIPNNRNQDLSTCKECSGQHHKHNKCRPGCSHRYHMFAPQRSASCSMPWPYTGVVGMVFPLIIALGKYLFISSSGVESFTGYSLLSLSHILQPSTDFI